MLLVFFISWFPLLHHRHRPLEDSSKLKAKFDDIFAATRYTKALEAIRKLRTEQQQTIKSFEGDLKVLENNMEVAHKLEDELEMIKSKIASNESKREEINTQRKRIQDELQDLGDKADQVKEVQQNIELLRFQQQNMLAEKEKAHDRMQTEYNDADSDLQMFYEQFVEKVKNNRAKLGSEMEQLARVKEQMKQGQDELDRLQRGVGEMRALENSAARKREELQALAARMAKVHTVASYKENNLAPADFVDVLQTKVNKQRQNLEAFKREARRVDRDFEADISKKKDKESKLLGAIKHRAEEDGKNQSRVRAIQHTVTKINSEMGQFKDIQKLINSTQTQLRDFEQSDTSESIRETIKLKTGQIRSNNAALTVLAEKKKQLGKQSQHLTQIKFNSDRLEQTRLRHNATLEKCKATLQARNIGLDRALPLPLPPRAEDLAKVLSAGAADYQSDGIEPQLRAKLEDARRRAAKAKGDQMEAQGQLSASEGELRSVEASLGRMRDKIAKLRGKLEAAGVSGDMRLEAEQQKAARELENLKTQKDNRKSMVSMWKKFLDLAKDRNSCPLCLRGLDVEEMSTFVSQNEDKLRKIDTQNYTEGLQKASDRKDRLEQLSGAWSELQRLLGEEKPPLMERLASLKERKAAHTEEVDLRAKRAKLTAEDETQLEAALATASEVTRIFKEVRDLVSAIAKDRQLLQEQAAEMRGQTLEAVSEQYDKLTGDTTALNRDLSDLQDRLENQRNEKQKLVGHLNKLREKGVELSNMESEKRRLKEEEKTLKQASEKVLAEKIKLEASLDPLAQEISGLKQEREQKRQENSKGEQVLLRSVEEIQSDCQVFQTVVSDLDSYEQRAQQKTHLQESLDRALRTHEEHSRNAEDINAKIKENEQTVASSAKIKADIQANMDYRERQRELVRHATLIEQKSDELTSLIGNDADLFKDIETFRSRLEQLSTAAAELTGQLTSMQDQANTIKLELRTPRYKDIDQRHKEKLVEWKTTAMANKDLETYYKALDRALMHFHSLKMKEINEVLNEYWRTTYHGKDIDEIRIVSDPATVSGKGRLSYNYRVVMKQGDTELDMRGRCSAGQKVLTCLLIRLALAQTFCLQCGVLALDEPTTNLDAFNVKSFAKALNAIISKRSLQRNFQLILITHDEQFVEELGMRGAADHYYRVYKDSRNHSTIKMLSFRD